jgi:hypothetical protein
MAGSWEGSRGSDEHPVVEGSEHDTFVERHALQPIDRQTNGPQLFYGLRYHTHIVKPGEVETFHDQASYWLWEPATETVTFTLAIPRGPGSRRRPRTRWPLRPASMSLREVARRRCRRTIIEHPDSRASLSKRTRR